MTAEIGLFALILALPAAAVQAFLPLIGAARRQPAWTALAPAAATAVAVCLVVAFAALLRAYWVSDFSLAVVAAGSHSDKPLLYKLAGAWASHEGSLLLWALLLALYAAAARVILPAPWRGRILSVQGMITTGVLLYILFAADPFRRLAPAPVQGAGLNVLLLDPALAVHPPLLYLGLAGLSLPFCFAVAALIEGKADAVWARAMRFWVLIAWSTLTAGIALGAWWSYHTLGWGGIWAWDPVENAALIPWLIATALLHALAVSEKRGGFQSASVLLALLAFSMALVGTFLTRSGVVASVHAFAEDPARGALLLALLAIIGGGGLVLFAIRAGKLAPSAPFAPVSRETGLLLANLFLAAAAGAVLIGTLAPLIAEVLWGARLSVGAPYYDAVIPLLLAPMLLAMPLGPLLAWRRGDLAEALRQLRPAMAVALITALLVLIQQGATQPAAVLGLALGIWLLVGTLIKARSAPGMTVAHLGIAVLVIALTGAHFGQRDALMTLRPGDTASIAGLTVHFDGVSEDRRGPDYRATIGHFRSERDGRLIARLQPEIRSYDAPPQSKAVVAIHTDLLADLYIVLGDPDGRGGYTVHLFRNPLVAWIFLAAALLVLGGILSLSAKRSAAPPDEPATAAKRQAAYAIPLAVLAALIALFGWRLIETGPNEPASELIGKPVPQFAAAPLEPGAPLTAAALKGRVTLVNFFASWCVPCRTEHAVLAEAARGGIRIVGIAYKDKPDDTRRFLARLGNPYIAVAGDTEGRIGRAFGVTGVPESYLVDRDGIIRFHWNGLLTEDMLRTQLYPLAERLK